MPDAILVLYHLTCRYVDVDQDPPQMVPEDDHSHGEVLKFTCPKCNHKVTIDIQIVEGSKWKKEMK